MRNFTLGFMIMGIIAMFVVRYSPIPKTENACIQCTECWWFSELEGDE